MRAAKMAAEVSRLRMDRELQDAAGTIPKTDRQTDRQTGQTEADTVEVTSHKIFA